MCSITKQLDSYSMLIVSKYFIHKQDYINTICVCKKFKETTEKLRFNPISITSLKLFPKIQTQYLYDQNDKKLDIIEHQEIWYEVNYEEYLKYKENNIKCHHITYTSENRKNYGDIIPDEVNSLSKTCFGGYYRGIFRRSYSGSTSKTITIPLQITSFGNSCFHECKYLESVKILNNITNISGSCFGSCVCLTSIDLPSSILSFHQNCFSECSFKTFEIPPNLTEICDGCFYGCSNLQSIIIPTTITTLQKSTFTFCSSLTNVVLPTSLISISDDCFSFCSNLKTIALPSSLIQIGKKCFRSCGLQSLVIPERVCSIGYDCFSLCTSLSNLKMERYKDEYPFEVSYNDSILYNQFGIKCPYVVFTNKDTRDPCQEITQQDGYPSNFIIPNGVLKICNRAFSYEMEIVDITIPTTVTKIGKSCFEDCSSLTSLSIPDSVKSIGINCFEGCKSLKEILIPTSYNNLYPCKVSYNEYLLLNKCGIKCNLNHISFRYSDMNSNKKIPTNIPIILNIYKTNNFTIPRNIISLKRNHLSEDITSITIPISVSKLCNECFKNYKKLEYITIPTTIKYIGKHLIDGCTSLTELKYEGDWNNVIVSYDDHLKFKSKRLVFNNIEYTKEDQIKYGNVIPSIVQSINQSFYNRSNQIFHIPTHITTLDNYMFHSTSGISSKLREIRIPTTIQTIPKYCFSKCYLLTKVELPTTLTSIQKKSFNKCISLTCINIPTSIIEIGIKSFKNCYSLTSINLPTPLPTLRTECFKNCTSLQNMLSISNDYY